MARKKPLRKRNQKTSSESNPDLPPMMSSEQMMGDISKLLQDKDFESVDEINQFLAEQFMGGSGMPIPQSEPESDLEHAQALIYEAHEARSKSKALKLVRDALSISPDCVDGYVLLAELNAKTLAEAWALYEAGVRAGERVLGDEFEELKGHFWGFIETRPYMRARLGLAITLWQLDRLHDAAEHMAAMLELNPNDNQGVRQMYIVLLIELDDTKRIEKLFKQYPDDWSAAWKYTRAIYMFRKHGAGKKADAVLREAIEYNPYVPPYILGKKKLPSAMKSPYYSPGDENEAVDYLVDGLNTWKITEGATDWLATVLDGMDT